MGYLLALREPERFSAYLPLNIIHPCRRGAMLPHLWRLSGPPIAFLGERLQRDTGVRLPRDPRQPLDRCARLA